MAKNLNYLKKLSTQASKYGLVGIIGNLIGYFTYILFTFLGLTPVLAITLLYPVGAIFGYYGNKEYTFSSMERSHQWSKRSLDAFDDDKDLYIFTATPILRERIG